MRWMVTGVCIFGAMGCDPAPSSPAGSAAASGASATVAASASANATGGASSGAAAAPTGFDDTLLAGVGGKTIAGQILDSTRRPAADVVVYVKGDAAAAKPEAPSRPVTIDQKDKAFRPRVMPVVVGTTVEFKNSDNVLHNVYSRAKVKSFDLGAFSNAETKQVTFDAPGRVDVFCAIHTNMHSIVLVLDTPRFAVTAENGVFRIPDVPAGKHTVVIWDEMSGEAEATVDVAEDRPAILQRELTKR